MAHGGIIYDIQSQDLGPVLDLKVPEVMGSSEELAQSDSIAQ